MNPLYPMLVRSRTSDATDPRDKLYTVLGLVDEREDAGLQPDYTLGVEEVLQRRSSHEVSPWIVLVGSRLDSAT